MKKVLFVLAIAACTMVSCKKADKKACCEKEAACTEVVAEEATEEAVVEEEAPVEEVVEVAEEVVE